MAFPGYNYWSATATVTYGVYVLANGAWVRAGGNTVYFYANGQGNPGTVQMSNQDQITINYGGDFSDFRVVIESIDDGASGQIDSVPSATWTSQSTSGQRSATPNGEKISATMRPQ